MGEVIVADSLWRGISSIKHSNWCSAAFVSTKAMLYHQPLVPPAILHAAAGASPQVMTVVMKPLLADVYPVSSTISSRHMEFL